MASLSTLRTERAELIKERDKIKKQLDAAEQQFAANKAAINQIRDYEAKRGALYNNVVNQYHCPTLYSSKSKRETCTARLKKEVDEKYEWYLNAKNIIAGKYVAPLRTAYSNINSLIVNKDGEIEAAEETERTLNAQGLTSDAVEAAAVEGEKQKAIIYAAQADALAKQAEIDNQARLIRNYAILAVLLIALTVLIIWLVKRLRKNKK